MTDLNDQVPPVPITIPEGVPPDVVLGYVVRRAKEGEIPNAWGGWTPHPRENRRHTELVGTEEFARLRLTYHQGAAYRASEEGWNAAQALREARTLLKAEPIKATDYNDPIVTEDRFFSDVFEYLYDLQDQGYAPAWAFAATPQAFDFNVFEAIDGWMGDHGPEDGTVSDLKGVDELEKAWKVFAEANAGPVSWWEDTSRVVVLDHIRFEQERAAARKLVEEADSRAS